ncbi:hypothetical protein ACFPT7_20300 [Acidicapsa dinghuensis]|uniref:Glycosyltransferase RgtA/B/C/D-like domain-containing protein n=1 Tax=Acidicapsa dinghuensis TaxID=2218256 RepID=A0ABW1ELC8_9BACT|nr:hypothetical protein [Acidicapsa dinghuensis]
MQRWIQRSIVLCLLLAIAFLLLRHPMATNDGPVHLAFTNQIVHQHDPGFPLQHKAYLVEMRPDPNLAVYLLMAGLMKLFSAGIAEAIIQFLCLAGPMCAAYFAIHMVEPKNTWLAIFVFPISLNQMFFLGLYNHCMSTAAFFIAIGTYIWMMKAPSVKRALCLAGSLVLAFFCHASGFLMSVLGIQALIFTEIALCWYREQHLLPTLRKHLHAWIAMLAPLPLVALYLMTDEKGATVYGVPLRERITDFLKLHELAVNYPMVDRFTALGVSIPLLLGAVVVGVRVLRRRADLSPERRDEAIGMMAGFAMAVIFMLAFPDIMGGGWTHFRRFVIFPYFWAILLMAFDHYRPVWARTIMAVGTSAAVALLVSTVMGQQMIRAQMEQLADADRLIGNHCTVLPIVPQSRPLNSYGGQAWMQYEPFFESASLLELTEDRVVLFNYLARLPAYPVHFRSSMEPQEKIFLWKKLERSVQIRYVDIPGFERSSGLRVDYILLWGKPDDKQTVLTQQIQNAIQSYREIYQSPNARVILYQRKGELNDSCDATPAATPLTGGSHGELGTDR